MYNERKGKPIGTDVKVPFEEGDEKAMEFIMNIARERYKTYKGESNGVLENCLDKQYALPDGIAI